MQSVNYWMIKRVIDISEGPYLQTKNKQLYVDREGATMAIISIEGQFGEIEVYYGKKRRATEKAPLQLEFL